LHGRFVNLFDSELRVVTDLSITSGSRRFMIDLDVAATGHPGLLASACRTLPGPTKKHQLCFTVAGVGETPGVVLLESPKPPKTITLAGQPLTTFEYSAQDHLLWIHFPNDVTPRELTVQY